MMTRKLSYRNTFCVVYILLVFSGAFLEQIILGPAFGSEKNSNLESKFINTGMYIPAYFIGLFFVLKKIKIAHFLVRKHVLFFLFTAYIIVSTAWSANKFVAGVESLSYIGTVLCALGLATTISQSEFIKLLSKFLLAVTIASLFYVYFIPSYGLMSGISEWSVLHNTAQGVFRHKNTLAQICAIGFLLGVYGKKQIPSILKLSLIVCCFYLLILSDSSTGQVTCVSAIFSYIVWNKLSVLIRNRTAAALFIILVLLCFSIVFYQFYVVFLGYIGEDVTFTGRTRIWEYSFDLINERLYFGWSLSSVWYDDFYHYSTKFTGQQVHSHNLFVEVLLIGGLVGFIIFIIMFFQETLRVLITKNNKFLLYEFSFVFICMQIARTFFELNLFIGNSFAFLIFLYIIFNHSLFKHRLQASRRTTTPPSLM